MKTENDSLLLLAEKQLDDKQFALAEESYSEVISSNDISCSSLLRSYYGLIACKLQASPNELMSSQVTDKVFQEDVKNDIENIYQEMFQSSRLRCFLSEVRLDRAMFFRATKQQNKAILAFSEIIEEEKNALVLFRAFCGRAETYDSIESVQLYNNDVQIAESLRCKIANELNAEIKSLKDV